MAFAKLISGDEVAMFTSACLRCPQMWLANMYHTIEFASEFITNLEICPNYRVDGLVIRKGDILRAHIKPYVAEAADGPVEVADLFIDDGTATFQVPFACFRFVD